MCRCFFCEEKVSRNRISEIHFVTYCPNCGNYILSEEYLMDLSNYRIDKDVIRKFLYSNKAPEKINFLGSNFAFSMYKKSHPDSIAVLCTYSDMKNYL